MHYTYFGLIIVKTARPVGNNSKFKKYEEEKKTFLTLDKLKAYLKEEYLYVNTKYRTFIDNKDGESLKNGLLYAFKREPILFYHWINIYEILFRQISI